MRKIFEILLLTFITVTGYCQCDSNKVNFIDSLGNEIDSNQTNLIYVLNNGKDTLYLDELHNMGFTKQIDKSPYGYSLPVDSTINAQNDTVRFCIACIKEDIKIIDSIDINSDGVKELFIFREWYCSAMPMQSTPNPYGVGGQQQYYSKYEVWDVQKKNRIFEINNRSECQVAVSVSVIRSYGFWFEVHLDNEGDILLSNGPNGIAGELEMGTYKYNNEINTYKRE
jgi:hypothetical protein